jgi:hypothetical protein
MGFLSPYPLLIVTIKNALLRMPADFVSFLLDPSTDATIIPLTQQHGKGILVPLFRFSRAWVWAAHRQRLRLLGLHQYLL